jgi:hypothetical protein
LLAVLVNNPNLGSLYLFIASYALGTGDMPILLKTGKSARAA